MQEMCCRSLDLKFKAILKLESGNQKIQNGHQADILKVTYLKINRLLSIDTSNVLLKFGLDIQSQTEVRARKQKNPRWPPGNLFKVTSLKINLLLPMATSNMHMKLKFWSKLEFTLRKPCRLQTDGQTDRRTRWFQYTPTTPQPPNPRFVGRGYEYRNALLEFLTVNHVLQSTQQDKVSPFAI